MRIRVKRNILRKVLIMPRWMLLVVDARGVFREVAVLGPVFSNQILSISWFAIF